MTLEEKKEWEKEIKRQLRLVLGSFFNWLFIFLIGYVLSFRSFWPGWMSMIWIVLLGAYAIYVFLFKFASEGIFITQVEEGTGKVVMRLGEAYKGLIQYKDRVLGGPDWDVVSGQEKHLFGGLRWIGIWPIYYIYKYKQRWTSVRESGEAISHEEEVDSTPLKEKIYHIKLEGAEDKDGIPVDIDILLTGSVVKLYKSLFGPHNYLEQVINRTRPLFREYVRGYAFMELSAQKQRAGGELWERLEKEKMVNTFDKNENIQEFGEFERDYGFRVKDGGIEMKNITPPKEYQKAQTQKYLAQMEADRIAGETIGAVINMMARSRGLTSKEMQDKINNSTQLQKEFREFCKDTLHKKMAIDGNAYVKIDVSGTGDVEKTLMDLVAAWQRMPQGRKFQEKPKRSKKRLSLAEKIERIEKFQKKGGELKLEREEEEEEEEESE